MLMHIFILLVLGLFLSGCEQIVNTQADVSGNAKADIRLEAKQLRDSMMGVWCGKKTFDDGGSQSWTIERYRDGTYVVLFKTTSKNGVNKQEAEYGMWGIRYPIYFTAVLGFIKDGVPTPANTDNHTFYEAYNIQTLTDNEFTYTSYKSGNTFTVIKECGELSIQELIK